MRMNLLLILVHNKAKQIRCTSCDTPYSLTAFLLSTTTRQQQACSLLNLARMYMHNLHIKGAVLAGVPLTREVCLLAIFGVLPELSMRERGFLIAFASSTRRRLLSILRAGREVVRENWR